MRRYVNAMLFVACFPAYPQSDEPIRIQGGGDMYLKGQSQFHLQKELIGCKDLGIASRDPNRQQRCEKASQKANDYLVQTAKTSPLPYAVWSMCARNWSISLDMGARCIAAATDICKLSEDGKLEDLQTCYRIMSGPDWTANPHAKALNFDR